MPTTALARGETWAPASLEIMDHLYPIIRRKRVPLIVQDAPAVPVGNVEPVVVQAVKHEVVVAPAVVAPVKPVKREPKGKQLVLGADEPGER